MKSLTLIIPKYRFNYYTYILFLSKLQHIYNFNILSLDPDHNLLRSTVTINDYVLILDRYCYIDFRKIQRLLRPNRIYTIKQNKGVVILPKQIFTKFDNLQEIHGYIDKLPKSQVGDLTKYCYISSIPIMGNTYENSAFVCLNDNDSNFGDWLNEFDSKHKTIYYNNQSYRLKIGKEFFIKKGMHIGVLPNGSSVYWDNTDQLWKKLSKSKISKLLTNKGN